MAAMKPAVVATREDPSFRVRMPKQLLKQLRQASAASGRSKNTEILVRLNRSLREHPVLEVVASEPTPA